MMEAQVLSVKSPLYGRRTGQWKIESFPFHLFHHIFPNHSFEARLQFFSILDGIPAYIKKMNNKKSVPWNLKHKIFKKGEYLYEEAENLLRQELRTPRNYNAILQAIAERYNKFGEISNRTEFSKSLLSQYLKNLQKLHVIKKNFPITQQKESRNARYILSDNYFSFWFQFVYPYQQLIEQDRQILLLESIADKLTKQYSFTFEQICQQLIQQESYTKVGTWWNKNEEIDVVALDELHEHVLFGECKWTKKKIGTTILDDLQKKSDHVTWKKGRRKEGFVLFSKSGFTDTLIEEGKKNKEINLFDQNDIDVFFQNQSRNFIKRKD